MIVDTAEEIFARAEMIVKVKEPQPGECAMLREGQILYTYLHLAPDPEQTAALVKSKAVCIAYETITGAGGGLPLLAPMSEVAGRMAIQAGAAHLEKSKGGMGLLLGGVPGVAPGHIVIIGAGVVGTNALQMAVGTGARVTVLDKNIERLRQLDLVYGNRIATVYSTSHAIEEAVLAADLVIGGVLVPGAAAPKLVTRSMISRMKKGAVVVDVAIDQGGCFETSHATTHADPDLCRRWRGSLLRGEHAGRRGPHLDLRTEQRHHRPCGRAGQQRLAPRLAGRRPPAPGPECLPGPGDLPGRGADPGLRLRAGRFPAGLIGFCTPASCRQKRRTM